MAELARIHMAVDLDGGDLVWSGEVPFSIWSDHEGGHTAELEPVTIRGESGRTGMLTRDWFVWLYGEPRVMALEAAALEVWEERGGAYGLRVAAAEQAQRIMAEA